jgi:cell division protein FtsL
VKISYKILVFFFIITVPLFFAVVVWQSTRYDSVNSEVIRIEEDQEQWVNASKRLIAGGASYASAARIEQLAKAMKLEKTPPENIIQVRIYEGN